MYIVSGAEGSSAFAQSSKDILVNNPALKLERVSRSWLKRDEML